MREDQLRSYFELLTNALVMLAVLAVLAVAGGTFARRASKPEFHPGLRRGETLDAPPGLGFRQTKHTLIFIFNPTSVDDRGTLFITRLAATQRDNSLTRVIALAPDSDEMVKEHLTRQHPAVEAIPKVALADHGLPAAPAFILLNSEGKILDFWIGRLSETSERQILKALEGA